MNTKLTFSYSDNYNPKDGHYTVCKVLVGNTTFISLGLVTGQTVLNEKQKEWFEVNGDDVVNACEALSNVRFKLLDKFCKDCKIKDT